MTRQPPSSLLFVCTGNICRSPTAEGVMRHALKERGLSLRLDSAGVASYHIGEAPDPRTQAMARRFGLDLCDLRARRLTPSFTPALFTTPSMRPYLASTAATAARTTCSSARAP